MHEHDKLWSRNFDVWSTYFEHYVFRSTRENNLLMTHDGTIGLAPVEGWPPIGNIALLQQYCPTQQSRRVARRYQQPQPVDPMRNRIVAIHTSNGPIGGNVILLSMESMQVFGSIIC